MSNKWNEIGAREKMQIVNGTALVISAIILYFLSFLLTMTIGVGVISAGATLLATGLAFFGITSYIKNQMMEFETKVNKKMKQLEDIEQSRKYE